MFVPPWLTLDVRQNQAIAALERERCLGVLDPFAFLRPRVGYVSVIYRYNFYGRATGRLPYLAGHDFVCREDMPADYVVSVMVFDSHKENA